MPQSVFNRYEKKYLMPERVYQELRGRLAPYMQVDFYGLHTICNIYYDTPDDLLMCQSGVNMIVQSKQYPDAKAAHGKVGRRNFTEKRVCLS